MAQSVECLLYRHGASSSVPRTNVKDSVAARACNPSAGGGGDRWIPGAARPVRLAYLANSMPVGDLSFFKKVDGT